MENITSLVSPMFQFACDWTPFLWKSTVVVSFVIGAARGFIPFFTWKASTDRLNCPIKSVEPIVNISRDVGVLVWYVLHGGIMSAVVGGTAPISVPILIMFSSSKGK